MLPFSKRGARPRTELNDTTCTALRPQRRAATRQPLLSRFLWGTLHARKPHREQPNAENADFQTHQKHRLGQGQRRNGGATGSPPNTRQAKTEPSAAADAQAKQQRRTQRLRCTNKEQRRTQTHGHKCKQKRNSCKHKHKFRRGPALRHLYSYDSFFGAEH